MMPSLLPLFIIIDFKNGLLRSTKTLARTTFETLCTSSVSRTFLNFYFRLIYILGSDQVIYNVQ